jgi:hypothetical protein
MPLDRLLREYYVLSDVMIKQKSQSTQKKTKYNHMVAILKS